MGGDALTPGRRRCPRPPARSLARPPGREPAAPWERSLAHSSGLGTGSATSVLLGKLTHRLPRSHQLPASPATRPATAHRPGLPPSGSSVGKVSRCSQ